MNWRQGVPSFVASIDIVHVMVPVPIDFFRSKNAWLSELP
jgi:hypothetical protein